jgi:hypothetical protein
LDNAAFCTQARNLLHGDRATPARLQSFSDYLASRDMPNGWPLPTYLLFMVHPETEMLVKPRAAQWFLRYVGETAVTVTAPPQAELYQLIRDQALELLQALAPYEAENLIDVQSVLWVAHREGRERTGRLDAKGQVDLDVPGAEPPVATPAQRPAAVREEGEAYDVLTPPDVPQSPIPNPPTPLPHLAAETGYALEDLERWTRAIRRKGQAIFYGPPGTGKTFLARRLARHLVGGGAGEVELIQFHPAYSYEDFMQGIRPRAVGGQLTYEWENGRFLSFCRRARRRDGSGVFIIDEINRANLAGVFGELMYLLEYRDQAIPLAGGKSFQIPAHVYILGTMNTADRSIALVDHALRRRFAFIPLRPNPDVLRRFHAETDFAVEPLIDALNALNAQIGDPHYHVGHTFFLVEELATHLPDIWRLEIEPYLEEYFYGQPERVTPYRWRQVSEQVI